jgi:hypothetical protein
MSLPKGEMIRKARFFVCLEIDQTPSPAPGDLSRPRSSNF